MAKIKNWQQHAELMELLENASAAIRDSSMRSGSHYLLMNHLNLTFGVKCFGRESAMAAAAKMLQEFESEQSGVSNDEIYAAMADEW